MFKSLITSVISEPSGVIRKNWNDTEKISMAPAQGWHAQIENVSLFLLIVWNLVIEKKMVQVGFEPTPTS